MADNTNVALPYMASTINNNIINAFIDTFDQFIASMVNRSLPPLSNLSYRKLLNGSVLKFPQKILRSKNCF